MTQLEKPGLTPEEQAHVDGGGRVFIIEKVAGPLWRVLSVSKNGCTILLKPDRAEGYSLQMDAYWNAEAIANLSDDQPMVRQSRRRYEIDLLPIKPDGGWNLLLLEDGKEVSKRVFLPSAGSTDMEAALSDAMVAALDEGEAWLSSSESEA